MKYVADKYARLFKPNKTISSKIIVLRCTTTFESDAVKKSSLKSRV